MRAAPGTAQLGMAEKLWLLQVMVGTKETGCRCVRLYKDYQQGWRLKDMYMRCDNEVLKL